MSTDENKALVRRFYESFGKEDKTYEFDLD